MAFILSTDVPAGSEDDPAFFNSRVAAYREYLQSLRDKLPSSAYEFAMADSHYAPSSPQCPHDSWVESLTISEPYSGARSEDRSIEISLRLLGAYHDGHIELTYQNVKSYSLETPAEFRMPPLDAGHGDWLTDEIRLSPGGPVLHEIEFSRGSRWIIECGDILYRWQALARPTDKLTRQAGSEATD